LLVSSVHADGGSRRKPADKLPGSPEDGQNPDEEMDGDKLLRILWIMNDSALNGGSGLITLKFAVTEAIIPVISSEC
jgi:hypothetical protein